MVRTETKLCSSWDGEVKQYKLVFFLTCRVIQFLHYFLYHDLWIQTKHKQLQRPHTISIQAYGIYLLIRSYKLTEYI